LILKRKSGSVINELMPDLKQRRELELEHSPEAIRTRLAALHEHGYLGDVILDGIDGCVTTFVVVAGTVGGGFPNIVAIVLARYPITLPELSNFACLPGKAGGLPD
jgi:hypothetical protein